MSTFQIQSYLKLARFHRPIGIWLLFFPCFWALCLLSPPLPIFFKLAFIFFTGSVLMRGAGCTYNDWVDRHIDPHVRRTCQRPLARQALPSQGVFLFLGLQITSASLLLLFLPLKTFFWALASLGWVFLYPWMKRWTYWPQFFLGATFGWGVFMAWSATGASFDTTPFLLYGASLFWTLGYDTIYAYQDLKDDAVLGVKSTALLSQKRPRLFMAGIYSLSLLFFIAVGITVSWTFPLWYGTALLFVAGHFVWQVYQLDPSNASLCGKLFLQNTSIGWVIALGMYLAR